MSTPKRIAVATTIVAIFLGWAPIQAALAADFTVTRTDDPSPDACMPDDCSLREAVIAANNRGGPDRILLSNQVYSLTRPISTTGDFGFAQVADLDTYDDLTIEGPVGNSTKATIDANGATMGERGLRDPRRRH